MFDSHVTNNFDFHLKLLEEFALQAHLCGLPVSSLPPGNSQKPPRGLEALRLQTKTFSSLKTTPQATSTEAMNASMIANAFHIDCVSGVGESSTLRADQGQIIPIKGSFIKHHMVIRTQAEQIRDAVIAIVRSSYGLI